MVRPQYKLKRMNARIGAGKFNASVLHGNAMDTQRVVQEAIDYCGFHISPYAFESMVRGLLESMIHFTLQDGMTRRFGDYFAVQLDVKGTFDSVDDHFDAKRHKVKLTLRPLRGIQRRSQTGTPENKVKPPCAHIDMVRSASGNANEIVPGEAIVITGRNLKLLPTSDGLLFTYMAKNGHRTISCVAAEHLSVNTETRLEIPFNAPFVSSPIDDKQRWLLVRIRSEGGKPGGKIRPFKYRPIVTVRPEA